VGYINLIVSDMHRKQLSPTLFKIREEWSPGEMTNSVESVREKKMAVQKIVKQNQSADNTAPSGSKKNCGALVRQRSIPTERPPLVGEVSANFSG
jgi:hypothetical protein